MKRLLKRGLKKMTFAFVICLLTHSLFAQENTKPANVSEKMSSDFEKEIKQFDLFLKQEFAVSIHFSKDWNSQRPSFSANASALDGKVIRVSGFDYRLTSLAAFRLGLCHEVGHYLAGSPFLKMNSGSIENTVNRMELSAEGQADYFAPYCLKKYSDFLGLTSKDFIQIPQNIVDFCSQVPSPRQSHEQIMKCEYISMAALDLVNYLALRAAGFDIAITKKIPFEAYKETIPIQSTIQARREYPSLNCRLKTYLAGILCSNDQLQLKEFVCAAGAGARPDCWYRFNGSEE